MIRYSCNSCSKSLRADESIVGRKAKCTRCGGVTEVPRESTRAAGVKVAAATPDNDRLSESFFDDDVDMDAITSGKSSIIMSAESGIIDSGVEDAGAKKTHGIELAETHQTEDPADVDPEDDFRPVFKVAEQRRKKKDIKIPPAVLTAAAGFLVVCMGVFWWLQRPRAYSSTPLPAFHNTQEAVEYKSEMIELMRSRSHLAVMGNGYLTAKKGDASELDEMKAFTDSVDDLATNNFLDEASEMFDAGNENEAKALIRNETQRVIELQKEAARRTEVWKTKTFSQD